MTLFSNGRSSKIAKVHFKSFFSRTTVWISSKLGTKNPWVKGIQICSNEGPLPLSSKNENNFLPTCFYIHNFAQVCFLLGNVSQVINVAHGPRVKFIFTKLKCALISDHRITCNISNQCFVNVHDFKCESFFL